MYAIKNIVIIFVSALFVFSCRESEKSKITHLVNKWQGKEIIFPKDLVFTIMGKDTVPYNFTDAEYKIVVYVDSMGCMSCKLQLAKWKDVIKEIDSVSNGSVPVLFFFHPERIKDIKHTLQLDQFSLPVCIDVNDSLNKLNNFPQDATFQVFLLDKENKVKVIGNPVHNYIIKELYIKQITGKEKPADKQSKTTIQIEQPLIDLGKFSVKEKKQAVFNLKNTGTSPLVILDVNTTCGCATVKYDKHPASPGKTLKIEVEMTPKDTGFFEETITVKSNASSSPIKLIIKGQAQ